MKQEIINFLREKGVLLGETTELTIHRENKEFRMVELIQEFMEEAQPKWIGIETPVAKICIGITDDGLDTSWQQAGFENWRMDGINVVITREDRVFDDNNNLIESV